MRRVTEAGALRRLRGTDWRIEPTDPLIGTCTTSSGHRDGRAGSVCAAHVRDLIDRYGPDVFSGVGWRANFRFERAARRLSNIYHTAEAINATASLAPTPGLRHHRYQRGDLRDPGENCRGVGLSFGYNQVEDDAQYMSGAQAVRHVVGTGVSRRSGCAR